MENNIKPSRYIRVAYFITCIGFFTSVLSSMAIIDELTHGYYNSVFMISIPTLIAIFISYALHKVIYPMLVNSDVETIDQQYILKLNRVFYYNTAIWVVHVFTSLIAILIQLLEKVAKR